MSLANLNLSDLEQKHGLPSGLLSAVMKQESGGNPNAVSPKGALGAFQFMPETAKAYGINPLDPQQSAVGAARMFGDLKRQFNDDVPSMLAAYNWGSGNLTKKGMQNAPTETRDYIRKITANLNGQNLGGGKQYADSGQVMNDGELPAGFTLDDDSAALPEGFTLDKPQEKSITESVLDTLGAIPNQFLQGGSFGYGDEIQAGVAAPIASMMYGGSVGDNYDKALGIARDDLAKTREESPITSTIANVVGAIGTGGLAGKGIAAGAGKIAPELSQTIGGAIAANPIKSTAGLSGVSGAIYGSGTGEGGAGERAKSALIGGGLGVAGGALAGYGGQAIANKLASSAEKGGVISKIANRFSGKPIQKNVEVDKYGRTMVDDAGNVVPLLNPIEQKFMPTITPKEGEIFSKTAGQRLQNAEIQRLENSAIAGNLSASANQATKDAMTMQNQQFKGFVSKLAGGLDESTDTNALMDSVANTVKTSADDAWGGVNNAYKIAKEGGGVKIGADDIRQGLFKSIAGLRRENQYDFSQMPQARSVVNRLAKYSSGLRGSKISSVKLAELENWRTMATTASKNAQGSEKAFLSGMVRKYDDFMQQTADSAVDLGDKEAINAFKAAVSSRRNYGKLYESNQLVNDIVENVKSIDDVTRSLIGSGAIKGKANMAANLDAIVKAAGKDSENVRKDLQQAFAHKILSRTESGFAPDSQTPMISPAKLKTELENLFVNQSEFATKLYGAESVKAAKQAIKELALISQRQAKVGSSSGSGEMVEALVKKAGALSRIPFVSQAIEAVQKTTAGNTVKRGLSEFMPSDFKPSSKMFSNPKAVGAGNASIGELASPKPLRVTITGDDVRRAQENDK